MANTMRSLASTIAGIALIAGCASTDMRVGANFDYNSFAARVQPGTTDAKQVREWLGQPIGRGVEVLPDGERLEIWTYYYGTGKIPSGSNTSFKMLQVRIDQQGKVVGYTWTGDLSGVPVADRPAK
ncbi:MAG TPA: hypothetical protein VFB54_07490 [Burkholderiales bacterium]|nr:hypothetical protein [Burkholderiales bacterium]